ncbi:TPA: cell division protein FtsA [Candidatus Berkelbacteria bacterium]|uniref:Cell division protein FtsA n=1 Tax=Berkelbacteria bacterium GW2011_GWE1_39_12 TaxID=1618337 RepID=A0A0G4B1J5_9BACT|nr:MAG: cell division protein FtsA [Berkelbacteria bacterium GW2011_GWE1_39_12]HBO60075.1 cell division protein FtsA [Candidatus Berkelbacteria bacterium]
MAKDNIVVGLDVGTTKVAVTVGLPVEGLIKIIGYSKTPNAGMRKGTVVDVEDTVSAISLALEEAERMAGTPITSVFVSIGGNNIISTLSKGVIAVSRADGEVTRSDTQRVIEAAKSVALPPNREIIHCIPKNFSVDAQSGIPDPVGMNGIRLETQAIVIGAATSTVGNLSKCLHQAGVNIDGMVFNGLASSKALLTKKQKEMGVMLVDIGGGTTSIAIFEEGDLSHAAVIPIGSMHITNDIAIGLRTSLEMAEKIKVQYGSAMPATISESEKINMSAIDPQDKQRIERRYLAEIIHARTMEILNLIREELKKIGRDGMLPAGVVLTGGGSKLEDLVELAKEELRLPVEVGMPVVDIDGLVDKIADGVYSTSVGLMLYGLENPGEAIHLSTDGMVDKAKSFLKQFLP